MRSKVLQEIIETEKTYVNTLNDIVDVSMSHKLCVTGLNAGNVGD